MATKVREKRTYSYVGPVYSFNTIVSSNWVGSTVAPSPAKALANLKCQYKKRTGRTMDAKIELSYKYLKDCGTWMGSF